MKIIKNLLSYSVYFLLKCIFVFLKIIGKKYASILISKIFIKVGPFTKFNKRASNNITYIWPKISPPQKKNILQRMWKVLGVNVGEFIFLNKYDPFLCKETKIIGRSLVEKIIRKNKKKNKGIIFFSAHFI